MCAEHDYSVDCYDCEIQTHVNALCSHRRGISLCMISRYDIALKLLDCKEMAREFTRHESTENVWKKMKKEIGNQMLCKNEDIWK